MKLTGLSFNALPPIDLPFRFFLSAPVFMIICAILIFSSGESLWISRWHPHMLSLTHGFTLGFLSMVMMGALLQLLPVIGGIGIPKPRIIATLSHALLSLGTIFLIAAFMTGQTYLFIAATVCLTISLGVFLTALIWVLSKKLSQGNSIIGFRLSVTSLLIVALLGLALIGRNIGIDIIPAEKHITDIHAFWGLAGWAGLLIIAVSFQVIPMFHVAPSFPEFIRRYLAASLFILLIVFIFLPEIAAPLILLSYGAFAISVLFVISKRKRKVPDTSIRYWQFASISLLCVIVLFFIPKSIWGYFIAQDKAFILAAIFIFFYLTSIIEGMLLKILPFLSYTHLQQSCLMNFEAMQHIPHMHEFLSKKHGQWLFYLHLVSCLLLILVLLEPVTYFIFSIAVILEFSWLFFIMSKTVFLYFSINKKINSSTASI